MSDKITKAPLSWETGLNNSGIELPRPVQPIEGGIDDSRFAPTFFDDLQARAEALALAAKITAKIVPLIYWYLTMNWKLLIRTATMLIVAFLVSKWPALQSVAIGDFTLSQIVSMGLAMLATLLVPNQISEWKKQHPNEDLGKYQE